MTSIYETAEGRQLGKNQTTLTFITQDYSNENSAEADLLNTLENKLDNGHIYDSHQLSERLRIGVYRFRVTYKSPEFKLATSVDPTPLEVGEWSFSFDTTGRFEKVTQSLGTKAFDFVGRSAASDDLFKNAINVRGSGTNIAPEGVQIAVPGLKFQIRAKLPNSLITMSYAKLISKLTGTTNENKFPSVRMPFADEQFDPDTVLFLGAQGSWTQTGDIELVFHFDSGETVTDLTTGDVIEIVKLPHEFLWFKYAKTTTDDKLVVQPTLAFAETVYRSDDHGQIFTGSS